MEIKYTEEELNSIDKSLLIKMFLNLQNQMETLTDETRALNDKMQKMMEQLVLANNNRRCYGIRAIYAHKGKNDSVRIYQYKSNNTRRHTCNADIPVPEHESQHVNCVK